MVWFVFFVFFLDAVQEIKTHAETKREQKVPLPFTAVSERAFEPVQSEESKKEVTLFQRQICSRLALPTPPGLSFTLFKLKSETLKVISVFP